MIACLLLLLPGGGPIVTVAIPADRDATLIEDPAGALANGSGAFFFAGRTSQPANSIRRGLLRFDVATHVPPNAIIEEVRLQLHCSQTNGGPAVVRLHRALAAWGEGASVATGGSGAPAEPGDATWLHRFHAEIFWTRPGGHFVAATTAAATVAEPGTYLWASTPKSVADVRLWLHNPSRNHGWVLRGDEDAPTTSKRFDSRENDDRRARPVLHVTWRLP